jgi:hypothetical protein
VSKVQGNDVVQTELHAAAAVKKCSTYAFFQCLLLLLTLVCVASGLSLSLLVRLALLAGDWREFRAKLIADAGVFVQRQPEQMAASVQPAMPACKLSNSYASSAGILQATMQILHTSTPCSWHQQAAASTQLSKPL